MSMEPQHEDRWEKRDVDVGSLLWLTVLLIIGGLLMVLVTGGTLRFLKIHRGASDQPPPPTAKERAEFPQPRLQTSPPVDLENYRAAETRELTSYGWVDQQRGVIRIPIDRAIELLVERGLPQTNQRVTPTQLQQQIPAERMQNATH